jgi:hypothetical protein
MVHECAEEDAAMSVANGGRRTLKQVLAPDLPAHRGLLVAGLLFLALIAYGLIDSYLRSDAYAGHAPVALFLAAGAVALLIGLALGRGAPRKQQVLVAFLLAGAVIAASYPLLLRINATTDTGGVQLVTYHYVGKGAYQADHGDYPDLDLARFPSARLEDRRNSTHQFEMVRGGLGFYQYNQARFRSELQDQVFFE